MLLATGSAPGWGPAHLPVARDLASLSNAPPHTHLLAPKSTSAKLATWRCQPLIHLPPEARAMAVPDPAQLSPHFSLRPQNPAFLWPPPSTWGSLALVTLPHTTTVTAHFHTHLDPPVTPLSWMGCRPERQQTSAAQPPWAPSQPGWRPLPQTVPTAPTLCTAPRGGLGCVCCGPFTFSRSKCGLDSPKHGPWTSHPHPHCPTPPPP